MEKLKQSLQWLDKHLLKILVIGFIFIIPLYPKLPLRMINYTFIAIRLEDIYVAIMGVAFAIQFFRKKLVVPWNMFWLFFIFWAAVFASFLWGYYVQGTVIIDHLGFLHSARRIEYMLIFFVIFATIRSKKDFLLYLKLIFIVLAIVSVYGYGQKFLGWPAVQTMNPEYAKGYLLILDSWARVSSTFAGHYDLAAYLILLMPIVIGYYLYSGKKIYLALFMLALGVLVLTASRASYIAYLMSISLFLIYIRKFKILLFVLIATAILTPLSDNLSNRLTRTFQQSKVFVDSETGETFVARKLQPDDLPPGDFGSKGGIPAIPVPGGTEVKPEEEQAARKQIREALVEEAERSGKKYSPEEINAAVDQIFSRQIPVTKYLPDISISTRFQVSWPRAFAAFNRNLLLGSGPSSLGEATDGDYLRWLGEMGLIGTTAFLAIFTAIAWRVWQSARHMTRKNSFLFHSFVFAFMGVFINASYIDIFEASKLAYTFWLVAGLFYAGVPFFVKKIHAEKLKI